MIPLNTTPEIHDRTIKTMTKVLILAVLSETNYNISESAKKLGISRPGLYRRMAEYGIRTRNQKANVAQGRSP